MQEKCLTRNLSSLIFINRNFVEWSTTITLIYLGSLFMVVAAYLAASQIPMSSSKLNVTTRSLPLYFFVDVQESPSYEVLMVIQMITLLGLSINSGTVDTVGLFYVMVACGHLRSLQGRLQALYKKEYQDTGSQIVECIIYHQKIIE